MGGIWYNCICLLKLTCTVRFSLTDSLNIVYNLIMIIDVKGITQCVHISLSIKNN